jgi:ribosomal protein L11 methyltransferase
LDNARTWPAIEIALPALAVPDLPDLLLARLDDFHPTALQEHDRVQAVPVWHVFFPTDEARDRARHAVASEFAAHGVTATALDVDDEDWAARSQARLTAVAVGRFIVAPPWDLPSPAPPDVRTIVIEPSMGFGTGHHSTTRLCLTALQALTGAPARAIDIGTGSGVLAIAAALDGAAEVLAIDDDADALAAARENVERNGVAARVRCQLADFRTADLPQADVVVANLTGVILGPALDRVIDLAVPGGLLVLSGFTVEDILARPDGPVAASPRVTLIDQHTEEGWTCLTLRRSSAGV